MIFNCNLKKLWLLINDYIDNLCYFTKSTIII